MNATKSTYEARDQKHPAIQVFEQIDSGPSECALPRARWEVRY